MKQSPEHHKTQCEAPQVALTLGIVGQKTNISSVSVVSLNQFEEPRK